MDPRHRLQKVGRAENFIALEYLNGVVFRYANSTRVFAPHVPVKRIRPGFEPIEGENRKPQLGTSSQEIIEDSIARSRRKLMDYIGCNTFDLFVTFTFKSDRQNIDKCKQKMTDWFKNQKKRNGKFEYIVVPEFHKDRTSLHFHALLKDYPGKIVNATNPKTGKALIKKRRKVCDLPGYRLGHTEAYQIPDNPEDQERTGFYLMKYLTKDMPRFFGKNRYRVSHGLKLPERTYGLPSWYGTIAPEWAYDTKYGRVSG